MKITKAVIPCGGLGTRFLPVTKALPKELLPIVDTPGVSYIIEEAAGSGITDVLLILGEGKDAIKKYFSRGGAVVEALEKSGKHEQASIAKNTDFGVNISYAYQSQPRGSADAVYLAKAFTGDEPFCLAWGDDVIFSPTPVPPVMKQLIDAYEYAKATITGVQYFKDDSIVKYGVAKLFGDENLNINDGSAGQRLYKCRGLVEKPALDCLPSRFAALGRYVLTKEIYGEIERIVPNRGELQLTDAINSLCEKGRGYIYSFEGKRYDCGDKLGFIKATVEYGLRREFGAELMEYLRELTNSGNT